MADRARRGALVLLALLAIVSLGCARPGLSSHPSQKQRAPVQSTKLDNGLTLTVQQDKSVPLVTLDMWVRVGGGDEPAEMAGVSHFLEHMLFKGTERLAVGEYDKRIEEVGGYLNAATSLDYTHYFVTIPSQHFDRVLEDFSDVLLHSSLDPAEVEGERQVILEEISRKIDNPFSYLFDETIPALFEAGPYTHPVIGSRESVTGMTREQLFAHYRRFYTPDNMFLSVVGDVDPAEARAKVAKAFGAADAKLTPWREKPPATAFRRPAEKTLPMDWNEAYFIISFAGPSGDTLEQMALHDLAETVLAGGRSSRLVNALQEKQGLVSSIGCYFPTNRHASPLMIYGTCEPGKLEAVRSAVFVEIRKLTDDGIGGEEMQRVQRLVRNAHLFSLETNAGRASTIGYSRVVLGNARLLDGYEEKIRSVERRQVEGFIGRYLREKDASFHVTRRANGQ